MDVEDVALGHETKMRWNEEDAWVRSADLVHEPIVTEEEFAEVQQRMAANARRSVDRRPRATDRPYVSEA